MAPGNLRSKLLHKFEVVLVRKPEHVLQAADRKAFDARVRHSYVPGEGLHEAVPPLRVLIDEFADRSSFARRAPPFHQELP